MITLLKLTLHGWTPVLLYAGAIVAFLVATFWRPRYGLYFLIPMLPLQTVRYRLHPLPYGEKFVDFILLGVILGLLFRRDGTSLVKTPLNKLLILLGIFLYVSLWRGSWFLGWDSPISIDDPRFSDWKNYLVMPLLFVVVAAAIREVKHMKVLILLMAVSFLLVNRSFYSTMADRDLSQFTYGVRDAGPLGYAGENGLAAFVVQYMLFMLAMCAVVKQKWAKLAILGVVATGIYSLLYTFSRGGYLAFVIGLAFLGLVRNRKLLILVAVLVIAWQTLLPASVQQRITMTYDAEEGQLDPSAETRVDLWEDAVTLFHQNPVMGTGFNTYSYMHRVKQRYSQEDYKDTHNYYLKMLVETGIVGLLLFCWLLWHMFRLGFQLYRTAQDHFLSSFGLGFAVLMVGTLILNLFGDRWTYMQVNCFLWVILGCVVRGLVITQEAAAHLPVPAPVPARTGILSALLPGPRPA